MKRRYYGLASAVTALVASPVLAQPRDQPIPAAVSTTLPQGISVRKSPIGEIYVDAQGHTLYGMNTQRLRLDTTKPNLYCRDGCLDVWQPVAPPPGTTAVPGQVAAVPVIPGAPSAAATDWMYADGVKGPQLMYKRTNLVYIRKNDIPGSTKWDGEDNFLWNVLRYVPPVPKIEAPNNVATFYVGGAYAMIAKDKETVLYTCAAACAKAEPFKAGIVAQGVGDWTVLRSGDTPQWVYRGKPVFVSQGMPKSAEVPVGAAILRPDPAKAPMVAVARPAPVPVAIARPAPPPGPAYWSAKLTIATLLADPGAKAVVVKYFPEVAGNGDLGQASGFTLKDLQNFLPDLITDVALAQMDAELAYVPAPKK